MSIVYRHVLGTLALSAGVIAGTVLADSGIADPSFGPLVHDGPSLDRSTTELNAAIQQQYLQEAILAALQAPMADSAAFDDVAHWSFAAASIASSETSSGFGPRVFDDVTLERNVRDLNANMLSKAEDEFLALANEDENTEPAIGSEDFDYVAAILGSRLRAEHLRHLAEDQHGSFGPLVWNGPTLSRSLVVLSEQMARRETKALMLATRGSEAVIGASFDLYVLNFQSQ